MKNFLSQILMRYSRWTVLSGIVGILAGLAATVFLVLLQWATVAREQNQFLIWLLPFAGFGIGLVYYRYGKDIAAGNNLILDEIHNPKKQVPLRMAPFILLGTVVTHLFGGSAGREGTAVQMGASLADQLSSWFRIESQERKILLVAGAGAGFGAAIGAPWAGMIFGMEVIHIGRLRLFAWFECLVASFVSHFVTIFLHAPHSVYPRLHGVTYDIRTIFLVIIFGCVCGAVAWMFTRLTHIFERSIRRTMPYAPLKPVVAGLILVLFYYLDGTYQYAGLGIPVIQNAFTHAATWQQPLFKGFFTALTVSSGFKGGEFIPLVFIGATLGSALSVFLKVSTSLFAALGFSAVFAGASNTPLACTLMTMEIFGPEVGGYALLACFFSYYCSGSKGIYKAQKVLQSKHHHWMRAKRFFGELPGRF